MTDEKPTNETTEEPAPPEAAAAHDALAQLMSENEQLKASIRLSNAHRQITAELEKAGARSPELLFTSLRSDLQYSDDGELQNGAALIAELKTEFPEQFGNHGTSTSIDAGSGTSPSPMLNATSLARMTADEIARLDWDDVKRILAS